jgi:hypothetical protein
MTKRLTVLLYLASSVLNGCVSIQPESISSAIETDELSDHVHFLAQPKLKGRKPRTWESSAARKYLRTRLEAYGIEPWADRDSYEQPFGLGTNVIGVLPGSDPNLADEIIMVSAHYDHVGKNKGKIHSGACDNASGVVALLEIAEHLSMKENRPRRSVCFAFFDCEEQLTLGSFVFTCQDDFDASRIAAVVNVDLLGRDFLDVVTDSIFVVGSDGYPQLQTQIKQAGQGQGLKVLPVTTDLVGPRGDHVAFETLGMPVLFFSCGTYGDYHKETDTADRLNYSDLRMSAELIRDTVDLLANAEQMEEPIEQTDGNKEELRSLVHVLETVYAERKKASLSSEQVEKLRELINKSQNLTSDNSYTRKDHKHFVNNATETLLPMYSTMDSTMPEDANGLLIINELYIAHRDVLVEAFRDTVKHVLENQPGLFGKVKFKQTVYDVGEDELSFTEAEDGQYQLDIILMQANLNCQMKAFLLKSGHFCYGFGSRIIDFRGSRDQVTDYCLFEWRKNLTNESYGRTWMNVLIAVTNADHGTTYQDWLQWRLKEHEVANEKQWLLNLTSSDNLKLATFTHGHLTESSRPELAKEIPGMRPQYNTRTAQELQAVLEDANASSDALTSAIWSVEEKMGKEGLLMLADALDDQRPSTASRERPRFTDESYPLAHHWVVKSARKWWEKQPKVITIGDDAQMKLKLLTDQNFRKDTRAWRKWIKNNVN